MTSMGRSEKWAHSRAHWGLSDAGAMTRPRRTLPVRQRMSQQAIAWAVLPSPMSSARSSRPVSRNRFTPSRWYGVERTLQPAHHGLLLGGPERRLDDPLELRALVDEQGAEGRVVRDALRARPERP